MALRAGTAALSSIVRKTWPLDVDVFIVFKSIVY
jgi:hypothetical protein